MTEYTKFPNQISAQDGWHINHPRSLSPGAMKQKCDEQLQCQGYVAGRGGNTIYYGLHQAGNWSRVNDGRDLYVKMPPDLPKYKFVQNRNVRDNTITRIGNQTPIKDVVAACDADPECKAFNTYGELKSKSSPVYAWGNNAEKSMGLYVKDPEKYCEFTGAFDTDPVCIDLCTGDPSWCRRIKRDICKKKGLAGIDDPMCKTLCSNNSKKDNNKDICDPIYKQYCELPENKDKTLCGCFKNEMPDPGTVCLDPICLNKQSYKTQAFVDRDCPECAKYLTNLGKSSFVMGIQQTVCNALGTNLVPKTESNRAITDPNFTGKPPPMTKELKELLNPKKETNWKLIVGLSAGAVLFIIILITLIWQLTK